MPVQVETLDKLERRITLTLPAEAIASEVESRLRRLSRTVRADGFRPGKVPMSVVAQRYGYSVHHEVMTDKVGKVWGLGSDTPKDPGPWEGEQRNMWKPTQQEALWFHGGNLHQSRHYSQYLSLQLKARLEGIHTPVYGLQSVHHKR